MSEPDLSTERDAGPVPSGVDRVFGDLRGKTDGDVLALVYDGLDAIRSIEEGGVLRRLDSRTGELLDYLSLSDLENCWAFSPDGQMLVSGADGISIWDVETGMLVDRLHDPSWVLTLAFSADGELVASGHDDCHVRVWNIQNGTLLHRLTAHQNEVSCLAFSADGRLLASAGEDRCVILWDLETGKEVQRLLGHTDRVDSLAWSADGSRIASAGWDTSARIWDPKSGELLAVLNGQGECVHTAVFVPRGDRLITADSEGKVRVWDYRRLKVLGLLDRHSAPVRCLAVSPDQLQLATGGDDRSIHLWNLETYAAVTHASANPTPVRVIQCTSDRIFAAHQDGGVTCWDLQSGDWAASTKSEEGSFRAIAVANEKVVLGDEVGQVKVFSPNLDQALQSWKVADEPVRRLCVSNDGKTLASTAGLDGTVKLWNLQTGEPTLIIPEAVAGCSVEWMAFHPSKAVLATAGVDWLKDSSDADGMISLWDLTSHKCIASLPGGALRIAFSPDGNQLAAISVQRSVVVWDLVQETILQELGQEECFFKSLAYSPDGRFLVVGSEQNYLRVWDCSTWSVRAAFDLETAINDLLFPPKVSGLITGNGNSTCYLVKFETLS